MTYAVLADLETGSKEKDAAVFSLAAILFKLDEPESVEQLAEAFVEGRATSGYRYLKLHVGNQWLEGRRLDEDTQQWWMQARLAAPRKLVKDGTLGLKEAILEFKQLVDILKAEHQAVHGKDSKIVVYFRDRQFDDNILQHAAEQYGLDLGYSFNQRRDVRTYIDAKLDTTIGYIPDFKPFPELTRHHAMTDVLRDAAAMCEAKRRAQCTDSHAV